MNRQDWSKCFLVLCLEAFWILAFSSTACAKILRRIVVPDFAFAGSSVSITCEYDLRHVQLYSLKWYHNRTEFYRYVPTERAEPINIRPTHKFFLHEVSRNERLLVLSLSRLTPFASGIYQCELIAEHPSFRTETLSHTLTVLPEKFFPPVITHAKEIYEQNEIIKIGCQARYPIRFRPKPIFVWYLAGKEVKGDYVTQYGHPEAGFGGYYLQIPANEIVSAGGHLMAECALVLGNLRRQTSKILRVRMRLISYVNYSFLSAESSCMWLLIYVPAFLLLYNKAFH